jgi:hypothetical protein
VVPTCFAGVRLRRRSGEPVMAWKILSPISVQIKIAADVLQSGGCEGNDWVCRCSRQYAPWLHVPNTKFPMLFVPACNLTFLS